jgi:23S rRNA pseudouridine955/2504/2580 synthase
MRTGAVRKYYLALVHGRWRTARQKVTLPLHKYTLPGGERRVKVSPDGAASATIFRLQSAIREYSLLQAELKTGRTHQIRVHLAHLGYPILGDDKYGDYALNKTLAKLGLRRMFLHASRMVVTHPVSGEPLVLEAPLATDLQSFLQSIECTVATPV